MTYPRHVFAASSRPLPTVGGLARKTVRNVDAQRRLSIAHATLRLDAPLWQYASECTAEPSQNSQAGSGSEVPHCFACFFLPGMVLRTLLPVLAVLDSSATTFSDSFALDKAARKPGCT